MSTRSYVGIIKNGVVTFGYHHSDSHLEWLGIELYKGIKTNSDVHKLEEFAETPFDKEKENEFFKITSEDIFIEFCYGFNMDDEIWYVSSTHFADGGKEKHKLTEIGFSDEDMKAYLSIFYEEYRVSILEKIQKNLV